MLMLQVITRKQSHVPGADMQASQLLLWDDKQHLLGSWHVAVLQSRLYPAVMLIIEQDQIMSDYQTRSDHSDVNIIVQHFIALRLLSVSSHKKPAGT